MVKPTRVTNSIRALRFAAGEMTQAELADKVGVTRQTVIAVETALSARRVSKARHGKGPNRSSTATPAMKRAKEIVVADWRDWK